MFNKMTKIKNAVLMAVSTACLIAGCVVGIKDMCGASKVCAAPVIEEEAPQTEPTCIPMITLSPTPTEEPICPTDAPQTPSYEVVDDEYKQLLEYEHDAKYDVVILMSYEYVSFYLGCVDGEWVLIEYCYG